MVGIKIKPKGYLEEFLLTQKNGLTGNIHEVGYPYDSVVWGISDAGCKWYDFEQVAYWLDGFIRLGILLEDKEIIDKAKGIIYNVLNNSHEHDYLGPKVLEKSDGFGRWPHVVFFRSVLALYEYNLDNYILTKLKNHYLNSNFQYYLGRDVLNVEIMLKLYDYTNDVDLLNMAVTSYEEYNKRRQNDLCDKVILSNKLPYVHGVSFDEYLKLSIMLYKRTQNKKYLKVALKGHEKIDKHFMLLDGLHASNEFMISNDVYQSHETCCVSDYTWNLYYMYDTLKDPSYLDKVEKCIFNAGLGSITPDFKALQYFSCVNQVILTETSNHNSFFKGSKWMQYSPNPGTECCPGNVNRFMPNYILNMYDVIDDIIVVKLYGSSVLCVNNEDVLEQTTNYPFDEKIMFSNLTNKELKIKLRYPSFVSKITSNGSVYNNNEGYFEIILKASETINLTYHSEFIKHENKDYVYYTKGSIVYALNISHSVELSYIKNYPTYSLKPTSIWNIGIKQDSNFDISNNQLSIKGYVIKNYRILKKTKIIRTISLYQKLKKEITGEFYFTPKLIKPNKIKYGKEINVKLVPYKDTLLRITAFPIITCCSKDEGE